MSILDDLLPGSYDGVNFLIINSDVSGGRKDVKKSFPNSDIQSIEDLGLSPRTYNMQVLITGEEQTYLNNRDRFIQVLEEGGARTLIHPLYGQIENIVARSFTVSESLTNLGEAFFDIIFEPSGDTGVPIPAETSQSQLDNTRDQTITSINNDVSTLFNVSSIYPANFTSAVNKLTAMADSFEENTSFLSVSAEEIDSFNAQLETFREDTNQLILSPTDLATSVSDLFSTVNSLYNSAEDTFAIMQTFFEFGDDDTPIIASTVGLIEREQNNSVLNSDMQCISLVYAYTNATQIEFATITQAQQVEEILELQYQKMFDAEIPTGMIQTEASEPNIGISDDTKQAISELRVEVQQFFDEQKVGLSQIVNIQTNVIPARVLTYQYYGNTDLAEDIIGLNDISDVSFVKGDVEILSA
jgi:prophage DNA circulation protein